MTNVSDSALTVLPNSTSRHSVVSTISQTSTPQTDLQFIEGVILEEDFSHGTQHFFGSPTIDSTGTIATFVMETITPAEINYVQDLVPENLLIKAEDLANLPALIEVIRDQLNINSKIIKQKSDWVVKSNRLYIY